MDNIAFLGLKSSSSNEDKNLECISDKEYWTTEYIVDRLFFEMTESRDDAQGWEDYKHKGQRKKYYGRLHYLHSLHSEGNVSSVSSIWCVSICIWGQPHEYILIS
jgi:hypothetical protein